MQTRRQPFMVNKQFQRMVAYLQYAFHDHLNKGFASSVCTGSSVAAVNSILYWSTGRPQTGDVVVLTYHNI